MALHQGIIVAVLLLAIMLTSCSGSDTTRTKTITGTPRMSTTMEGAAASPSPPELEGSIVFMSRRDGNDELYRMDADGSDITNITNSVADECCFISVSPDGQKIAFSSNQDGVEAELYVMNIDGSAQTRLTNHPERDWQPSWSPDGTRIAFTSRRDGNFEIYVVEADGSGLTRLTNNPGSDSLPSFSPDGKHIAFGTDRSGTPQIYVMSPDGGDVRQLTTGPDQALTGSAGAWSPDSQRILFMCASTRDDTDICVVNEDGSQRATLLGGATNDYAPYWAPEGNSIAFTSERDGNLEIYMMNADGSNAQRITQNPAVDSYPAWIR